MEPRSQPQNLVTILLISSGLSLFLTVGRLLVIGYDWYSFLIWNLFLAWIPLGLSTLLVRLVQAKKYHFIVYGLVLIVWLLFLPNAPYIITDLMYLNTAYGDPNGLSFIWYDGLLILSYVLNGLLLGFVSLSDVHRLLEVKISSRVSWLMMGGITLICSFGVYVGRYLRWNSWDIVSHPLILLKDTFEYVIHPFSHPQTYEFTIVFSIFLFMTYIIFRQLFMSNSITDKK